ncbi:MULTISPECIES: hypothetical protein [unclassified Pseudoalteromonas]|uniref:hypothetical protein n=1 Tax=unclassified Pseudoalteromonas TaxID=194690 RepID=UPI0015FCFE61|nr:MULTISPECIES: hypothetical protein [unclassified Pseudoalteromonas]MBB1291006.1 hypothetical protein [Pseudoalteromonas sp. SR41-5]MBB1415292.1 hypothetical protein [Pseudoalteromonas sp. SG43-8]
MHFTGELSDMKTRYELVSVGKSDECGCPEEEWVIFMVCVTIHLEPVTGGHIFLDTGDWQDEKLVNCQNIEQLRVAAVDWVNNMPINNSL